MKTSINIAKRLASSLADLEIWIMGGAVFLGVAYEPALPFVVMLGVVFWFMRWAGYGRPSLSSPLNLPVLFLILLIPVSIYATPLPEISKWPVLRLLSGILLCFSLFNWANSLRRITWILAGFLALAIFLAGVSLLLVSWVDKFRFLQSLATLVSDSSATDLVGAIHPNVMAAFLMIFLSSLCAWLVFQWGALGWLPKTGLGLAILFISGILFLTQSRSAMIALAVGLAVLVILRFRRGWIVIGLALVVTAVIIFQVGPQKLWYSIGAVSGGTGTLIGREQIWFRSGLIIQDFPITGIGMGTLGRVIDAFYPMAALPVNIPHAHNLFLQIAVDLGLPGLIAWLACWFTILGMAWQLYRKGDDSLRALGVAVLCNQIAMGVHSMFECVTWGTRPAVIVWAIWGLTAAAWLQLRSAQKQPPAAIPSLEKPMASKLFPSLHSHPKTGS